MSSSQETLDGTPAERLTRRLQSIRESLMDTDNYLGKSNNAFLKNVSWQHHERGFQVFSNDSDPVQCDPVTFSVVLEISHDNCWVTPCGYWRGPNQVTKKFEDLKLSFQGEQPSNDVFSPDFPNIVNNLHFLFNQQVRSMGDKKATLRAFLSTPKGKNSEALKFRHAVFEPLGEEDDEPDDSLALADWPVIHPEANDAKQDMMRTHRVVPLPAYDIHGNLISPDHYRTALPGALVRINFTMSHWFISSHNDPTNSFVADVTAIRILADPAPIKTPMKRKTSKRDPEIGSSSKKKTKT